MIMHWRVAQKVERHAVNVDVAGSSPASSANVTARPASGGQLPDGPHYGAGGTRADSNSELATPSLGAGPRSLGFEGKKKPSTHSLAGDVPVHRPNLAIVRDRPFIHKRELDPVKELDAINNRCEFAACISLSVFGVSFGFLLAIAVALLDWS
jgi:hypothetical protein